MDLENANQNAPPLEVGRGAGGDDVRGGGRRGVARGGS